MDQLADNHSDIINVLIDAIETELSVQLVSRDVKSYKTALIKYNFDRISLIFRSKPESTHQFAKEQSLLFHVDGSIPEEIYWQSPRGSETYSKSDGYGSFVANVLGAMNHALVDGENWMPDKKIDNY